MRLRITPLAAQYLEEVDDYIALENASRAVEFLAQLQSHCEIVRRNSEGYRQRLDFHKRSDPVHTEIT